jgi:7,8-dihydroneopterin aldolase/epimerase/oxygenase
MASDTVERELALDRASGPVEQNPSATLLTDHISLRGITGFGHHGVFDFERELGQRFVVDVDCAVDLRAAGASDELVDTLDYGALAQGVVDDIERDPLNLIEALADRIATTLLADERMLRTTVTVHKPQAPMPVPVADTAVTVVRSRRPSSSSHEDPP